MNWNGFGNIPSIYPEGKSWQKLESGGKRMWTVKEYADMYHNFPNGMYRTSLETGEFLEANQVMANILGYDSPEELKKSITAKDIYTNPEDREMLIDHLRNCNVANCKPSKVRFIDKDGNSVWVMITGKVNEKEGYIEGSVLDISDRVIDDIEELQIITEATRRRVQEIDMCDNSFELRAHAG